MKFKFLLVFISVLLLSECLLPFVTVAPVGNDGGVYALPETDIKGDRVIRYDQQVIKERLHKIQLETDPSLEEEREVIIISNGILEVAVEGTLGYGVGTYTIRTGPGHSNPGQDVFYGGAEAEPWSTYNTVHVVDTTRE